MFVNGLGAEHAGRLRLRSAVGSGVLLALALTVLLSMLAASPASAANPCAPSANLFANPGFETGDTSSWVVDGMTPTPTASTAQAHTGTYSALVGNVANPEPKGDSSLYQQLTVPAGASELSFWYWPFAHDVIVSDWQDAYVTDSSGKVLATIFHQESNNQTWTNQTFDMTPYVGQTVRIKFLVHQDAATDPTGMYVDDVCLSPPTHTLTVAKTGSGSGTVSSSPAGIDCGPTCSAGFAVGASVTLIATPDSGSTFAGWSGGGCAGTGNCGVVMDADKAVTATFQPASSDQPGSQSTPPPGLSSSPVLPAAFSSLFQTHSVFRVGPTSTPLFGRTSRSFPRGTTFSFGLNQAATVTVRIQRKLSGRLVGRVCKAPSRSLIHRPRCTRLVTKATLRRTARIGVNRIAFSGRIRGHALPAGFYRAAFTAANAAGTSVPRALNFRIVRG
jgi:hypothetical protein